MSYVFPAELSELVESELASGRYDSTDELLITAVRLLRERDVQVEEFHREISCRIQRLDRGEGLAFEDEPALRAYFDDVQRRGLERFHAQGET